MARRPPPSRGRQNAQYATGGLSPMAFLVGVTMTRCGRQLLQLRPDRVDNAAQIAEHFRAGDTQHTIALGIEPAIALGIVRHLRILRVVPAVDLDDQSLL